MQLLHITIWLLKKNFKNHINQQLTIIQKGYKSFKNKWAQKNLFIRNFNWLFKKHNR